MIQVTFHRLETNQIIYVEISGHAESGPYGHDIVCAAVSALSIGAINSLTELGKLTLATCIQEDKGGYLSFRLPTDLSNEQVQIAHILLESLFLSLTSVQEEYSEYITIEEKVSRSV